MVSESCTLRELALGGHFGDRQFRVLRALHEERSGLPETRKLLLVHQGVLYSLCFMGFKSCFLGLRCPRQYQPDPFGWH